jgi:predicted metalloprotease
LFTDRVFSLATADGSDPLQRRDRAANAVARACSHDATKQRDRWQRHGYQGAANSRDPGSDEQMSLAVHAVADILFHQFLFG